MPGKMDSFKALSAHDKRHAVVNWLLDHAMIIIILLLAVYVQIQRPQFFGVPSLVNIVSLTAARLPMALGVAGCIVLADPAAKGRRERPLHRGRRAAEPAAGRAAGDGHRRLHRLRQRLRYGEVEAAPVHHHAGDADDYLRHLPDGFQLQAGFQP